MKNKILRIFIALMVGTMSIAMLAGCGKKDEEATVKVEVERIEEGSSTDAGETEEAVIADGGEVTSDDTTQKDAGDTKAATGNGTNPAKNPTNSSYSVKITPGVPLTEDQMKKIADEQQELLKDIDPVMPTTGGVTPPTKLEPNFGPDEKTMLDNPNKNPDLKPNFPDDGTKITKQPVTELKPNFPTDGQKTPTEGGNIPDIKPSFPNDGSTKLPVSLPPEGGIDPTKGNFPTDGQKTPGTQN